MIYSFYFTIQNKIAKGEVTTYKVYYFNLVFVKCSSLLFYILYVYLLLVQQKLFQ